MTYMKYCTEAYKSSYWTSLYFKCRFPSLLVKPPQLLVADYPSGHSVMFEIAKTAPIHGITEVVVLNGSALNMKTGEHLIDVKGQDRITAQTEFVRLPTLEEIKYYEEHSRL